ncbi:MAG TPA: hypothetical protein PLM49_08930, partial [Bacteroidales bacterium]|nr:hypothetical protein [Bacteroidales bacterium]
MKLGYKNILFGGVLFVLSLSLIVESTGFITLRFAELKGYSTLYQHPKFKIKTWMSAEYQDSLSNYLDNTTVFRPPLIRLFNECRFRLFDKSTAQSVVIGKNNQLFQIDYVREYTGDYFVGEELIRQRCNRIRYLQD